MTGKERDILDSIRDDIGELKKDVKALIRGQAASEERVLHCKEKFKELTDEDSRIEQLAQWSKGKILIFSGGVLTAGTIAGLIVKFIR